MKNTIFNPQHAHNLDLAKRKQRFLNKEFFENELKRLNELKAKTPDNSVLALYFSCLEMLTKDGINEATQYYDVISVLITEFEKERSLTKGVLVKSGLVYQIDYLENLLNSYAYHSYRFNKKI